MTSRFIGLLPWLALAGAPLFAQNGDKAGEAQPPRPAQWVVPPAPSLSPEEEAKTFKLAPGFHVELVAAEPLVQDPVAMLIGPDGRMWVVEMTGYMRDVEGRGDKDPIGRIVTLTDTDGDGRMDQRTVFLDKLILPRAIALIDGGLLFATPPKLFLARDTNGDGVADTQAEIADDYGGPGNVEHLPNGLMWGLDNWIYSANHTVRFKYEGNGKFARENTIMRGQWGISQDDTGRLYYNGNSDPLRSDALPAAYLKRNKAFTADGSNVQLVPADLRVWPGRITTGVNRGYKTLSAEGRLLAVTAANGPVVYRGALFPAEFRGDGFISEPTGHLLKRIKLTEKDGTVRGANAYEGREFLTSTDERFRPVNLFNGPDGALWIVDMYRGLIQDRLYVTSYLRKEILERGLEKPLDLGRIWRVVPDGAPRLNLKLTLAKATPLEWVKALSDPNGWTRDTAQRLLVERRLAASNPAVAAALRELATKGENPLGRLHALWTLDGSGALDATTTLAALADSDPRVVVGGIRVAENFFSKSGGEEVAARVAALLKTRTEPEVRLQLALSLGEIKTPAADEALRALVVAAGRQRFLAGAVVSGLGGREVPLIESLARDPAAAATAGETLQFATSAVLKGGQAASIDRVLTLATAEGAPEWVQTSVLAGVGHFLPKSSEGKEFAANLPAEPKPLLALAARKDTPAAAVAGQLLASLKWPGKAGAMAAAVKPLNAAVKPLNAAEEALFEKGKVQFASLCAACHQPNGQGLPGLAPSLIYSRWVLGDARVLARIVLNGKVQQNLIMPPWKAALDDEAIAGVLTFVRRSWGHEANPIPVPVVTAARRDTAKRDEPWSDSDLEEVVQSLPPAAK
ncbi:MAG: dehydrogenase [Opitutus sp.]|nr:dehydrogenase [Opitutus sp.]